MFVKLAELKASRKKRISSVYS